MIVITNMILFKESCTVTAFSENNRKLTAGMCFLEGFKIKFLTVESPTHSSYRGSSGLDLKDPHKDYARDGADLTRLLSM